MLFLVRFFSKFVFLFFFLQNKQWAAPWRRDGIFCCFFFLKSSWHPFTLAFIFFALDAFRVCGFCVVFVFLFSTEFSVRHSGSLFRSVQVERTCSSASVCVCVSVYVCLCVCVCVCVLVPPALLGFFTGFSMGALGVGTTTTAAAGWVCLPYFYRVFTGFHDEGEGNRAGCFYLFTQALLVGSFRLPRRATLAAVFLLIHHSLPFHFNLKKNKKKRSDRVV